MRTRRLASTVSSLEGLVILPPADAASGLRFGSAVAAVADRDGDGLPDLAGAHAPCSAHRATRTARVMQPPLAFELREARHWGALWTMRGDLPRGCHA